MSIEASPEFWRRCSSCKNPIAYKTAHYVCSVSTCTRKRTGYVFCSVHCWERHLPGARHRDAAAIEALSPSFEEWKSELAEEATHEPKPSDTLKAEEPAARRFIVREGPAHASNSHASSQPPGVTTKAPPPPKEILIVASKLKGYIRARSEMNTSDAVMEILSEQVRRLCDDAIDRARADGRKTVLERDFK
jgi:hypothetical protein